MAYLEEAKMMRSIKALIVGMAIVLSGYATAQASQGVSGVTGGTDFNDGTDYLLGWSFTPRENMDIAALGVYAAMDFTSGQRTFTQDHQVGLYDAGQNLLASTTITNNDDLYGKFRFRNLNTVQHLTEGSTYYLATAMGADQFIYDVSGFTVNQNINFGQFAYTVGDTLAFPGTADPGVKGYFGPNFDTTPVPEPSTLLLVAFGLGGTVFIRKRAVKSSHKEFIR
jgi:Domain of unknown function (DUF4082)/PEP-CTERM motif